jgi:hypothetical protein
MQFRLDCVTLLTPLSFQAMAMYFQFRIFDLAFPLDEINEGYRSHFHYPAVILIAEELQSDYTGISMDLSRGGVYRIFTQLTRNPGPGYFGRSPLSRGVKDRSFHDFPSLEGDMPIASYRVPRGAGETVALI